MTLITKAEAAKRLNVCERTINRLMSTGQLRYVKVMECVRFDTRDIEYFIDCQRFTKRER